MKPLIALCGAAAGLVAICAAHGASLPKSAASQPDKTKAAGSQAQRDTKTWRADPRLAKALAPPLAVNGYAIRLPIGFREAVQPRGFPGGPPPPPGETHLFTHTAIGSESAPTITVAITPATSALSPDTALSADIAQIKRGLKEFTAAPIQHGALDGLPCARAAFQGLRPGPAGPIAVLGVAYAAVDGHKKIALQAEASGANCQSSLAVAEAAILTFRKG